MVSRPILLCSVVLIAGCNGYGGAPVLPGIVTTKDFYADSDGRPIYYSLGDRPATPQCRGQCAKFFEPVYADKAIESGAFSTFRREDGKWQWQYHGRPLYRSPLDTPFGRPMAEGREGIWMLLRK